MKIVFPKIKTLAGVKGTIPNAQPGSGYDDITLPWPLCQSAVFQFSGPTIYYLDKDGYSFGAPVGSYEWQVPKNWTVNGTISTGSNTIVTGSPQANIGCDKMTGGFIKVRGRNDCNPTGLTGSDWVTFKINRPSTSLKINGQTSGTINCGDQSNKVFALDNLASLTCATSFTWTVGNGWKDINGNNSPSTVTTSTGTLTLAPDGQTALTSPVSVSFIVDGITYTYQVPITFTTILPDFTVSGPTAVCSSTADYQVNGLTPGSTVVWTTTSTNLISLTPNGNNVGVTALTNANGTATLMASVTSPCGNKSFTWNIFVGKPQIYSGFYSYPGYGPYGLQEDEELSYSNSVCVARSAVSMNTSMDVRGANTALWSKVYSTLGLAWNGTNYYDLGITFKAAGQKGIFALTATNTCGSVTKSYGFQAVSCSALQANYSLYPNPASSVLNIETTSDNTNTVTNSFAPTENATLSTQTAKKTNIKAEDELQVQFFNIKTSKLELTKKLSAGSKKIDVSGLSRGTFLVVIKNRNNEIVKKEQVVLK